MNAGKNDISVFANSLGLASIVIPTAIYLFDRSAGENHVLRFVSAVSSSLFTIFMLSYWIIRNWRMNVSGGYSKESVLYLVFIVLCLTGLFTCIGETFLYGLGNDRLDILKIFATFSSINYIRFKCLGLLPRPVYRSSGIGNLASIAAIILITCAITINAKTNNMFVVLWSFVLSGAVMASISLAEEIALPKKKNIWDVSKNHLGFFDLIRLILFSLAYYWPERSKF
ncbi:hypothetical protein EROM_090020 [Encephalitozoon romaleae SJ-2008]|uniref:Uncharacterized protein n=1 Tax=Encephalitozoon romaleae (strain SJ-2008) TaxID=1178016 RepID=I7AFV1_ENCRO|nr:hypothetical protein EROM_090020 [Encephalitozoon romaleae SJ-2008]AFN83620.1 hypothetical protein EROM_090020 [Encephalitozoon romaleae SJ-2008]